MKVITKENMCLVQELPDGVVRNSIENCDFRRLDLEVWMPVCVNPGCETCPRQKVEARGVEIQIEDR